MPRLKAVQTTDATGKARELLEGVEKRFGRAPNIMRTMANSPAVLEAYLAFNSALAKGALSAKLREQIALAVGESNQCKYCLAAHAALGKMAGLSEVEIADSRRGASSNGKTQAVLGFARKVVRERGWVGDDDVATLRSAGFDDGGIAEIVATVAVNIFTNYLNHVSETEVDFPEVSELQASAACACA